MAHPDPAVGLTAEAVADRRQRGLTNDVPRSPSRSTAQIVRSNVLTPINLVVGVLAGLVIAAGSPKDALFGGVIVANSAVGIVQELRAKRVLDRLSVLNAPRARVVRDGDVIEVHPSELVLDDIVRDELVLETPMILSSMFNPIDLARILILLELDISVLMGATSAVFKEFLGNEGGMAVAVIALVIWSVVPLWFSLRYFNRKDL